MSWLIVIILSYFLFAVVSLVDRYLLIGSPNPKIYTFYVGVLGILTLLLVPFVGFSVPGIYEIIFCLLVGAVYIFALFFLFFGLEQFEASTIIPGIGGFLPIFTLLLIYFFSGGRTVLNPLEILAFFFLVLGSVTVSWQAPTKIFFKGLGFSALTGLFLSLNFVLAKYVYLMLPFWTGFIWIRVGAFLTVLFFLFTKQVRKELFSDVSAFSKKTGAFFLFNQAIGAGAFTLQNWAIALAGLAYLSVINALQGIQYALLFILTILFSKIFKEEISKKVILQKIIAILFIGVGVVILAL